MAGQNEIKCNNCGEWSVWSQQESDKCVHCGEVLRPVSDEEKDKIKKRLEVEYVKVHINEDDNIFVKLFKHVFNFVQMIFIAIISFLIWLFVASPG